MRSPIPWQGSKRRLAPMILKRFPEHTCYVELFAGSGALLFARDEPSKVEVLNDLDGELTNFFRVLKHHLVEFCAQFRWAVSSRKLFEWTQATPPETLTDIHRAARFYYLQRLCFGGKAEGRTFGYSATAPARLNLVRLEEDLSAVHARLAGVFVESLPWQDCLRRYDRPGTLFFADPPYYGLTGYAGARWRLEDYRELAAALRAIQGKALLTINEHALMRDVFDGFACDRLEVRYTVGGEKRGAGKRTELLYRTW